MLHMVKFIKIYVIKSIIISVYIRVILDTIFDNWLIFVLIFYYHICV